MEATKKKHNEEEAEMKQLEQERHEQISEKERAAILEEMTKTKEALRELKRQQRVSQNEKATAASIPSMASSSLLSNRMKPRKHSSPLSLSISESSNKSVEQLWEGVKSLSFTMKGEKIRVERLALISNNVQGGSVYCGYLPDLGGKLVAISEWTFLPQTKKTKKVAFCDSYSRDENNFLKQVSTIEQELSAMSKVKHPNVVQYLGLSYDHPTLRVYEEFVHGSNLSSYLSENISIDQSLLNHFTTNILEALKFMHEHNVVHRDLRDTSIYMESTGLIKVGDFSIDKRVRDLILNETNLDLDRDKFPLAVGRGGKKVDIYRLGVLVLSFHLGEIVHDPVTIPKSLSQDFADFLRKCLVKDERDRWSADQLLEHAWIKHRVEHLPSPMQNNIAEEDHESKAGDKTGSDSDSGSPSDPEKPLPSFWINNIGQSRLKSEFSWLSPLGKGGFGEVFKVKNSLDSQVYAIKRIKLDQKNKQLTRKLRKEVELLSRLNHENVVRYYNSWIEACPADEEDESTALDSDCEESALSVTTMDKSMGYHHQSTSESDLFASFLPFGEKDSDDDDIIFEHSSGHQADESDEDFDEYSDSSSAETADQVDAHSKFSELDKKPLRILQYLYIQMEFCDNQTLRSAIDNNLHQDTKRMWKMFREIIEGLHHIHSQGMIHRDLKPVNIFLDSSDQIKIGDFGLATTNFASQAFDQASSEIDEKSDMTGQIGTAMYVAPEINAGRVISAYNQKVDIYSLGIIFFEMCQAPLSTGMERIKVLSALRTKDIILPSEFADPLQTKIIRWLLHHDPSSRPTSLELLQSDYLPPPQVEEAQLQEMVRHTLASHNSKSYRHLVDACLGQTMDVKRDVIYDIDLELPLHDLKNFFVKQEFARTAILDIFRRHGAIHVTSPQLTPKGKSLDVYEKMESVVKAMTRSGNVVFLPFDLRVPLARYFS